MQSVEDKWYTLYAQVATAVAAVWLLFAIGTWLIPSLGERADTFGVTYITAALAAGQIAYTIFGYKTVALKQGHWQATLFLALFNVLSLINLIHITNSLSSFYLLAWGILVLLSGMFGTYAIFGAGFVMTTYFLLITTNTLSESGDFKPSTALPLAGTLILGVISHYLWEGRYVNQQSKQLEKLSGALKNNQQQSEMLIQSLADGVIVVNTEGKISLINPVAAAMTEWPIDEAMGIDVNTVVRFAHENGSELEENEYPFTEVLETHTNKEASLQLMGRGGKQCIVSLVISPVKGLTPETTGGAIAVLRDISAARKEEKQRADFISTASHEMRTPVAAIEGYLALALNEKVSRIDPKARSYLDKAHESTQHLGKLFQDLLTSAKAEDGRLVSHPVVVEMGAYLEQLTDSFRFAAQKKGLLTDFIIGTAAQPTASQAADGQHVIRPLYYVHVDPDRLREVVTNLFDNAVKYTPTGKISLGLTGNDRVVQLYVRDTGPGIPAEDISHLFQKFYRVDNTATRTIGGTGLGLFICRKIVELYKGRIWVDSQVGQGSTFYINLPRISSQKAAELQRLEAQNQGAEPVSSLTTPVV